jgi:hypothetical protein
MKLHPEAEGELEKLVFLVWLGSSFFTHFVYITFFLFYPHKLYVLNVNTPHNKFAFLTALPYKGAIVAENTSEP